MKRVTTILLVLLIAIYLFEKSDFMQLSQFKPIIGVEKEANEYILSWSKVPYPAYYEVEVLTQPPAGNGTHSGKRIVSYKTWNNQLTLDQSFPFKTYWRVSAHGLFNRLGSYSDSINLAQVTGATVEDFSRYKPTPTAYYPHSAPASSQPMLTWTVVPGAVYYEIEFLSAPPENPNDILPSEHQIFSSKEVFTNGYNADLSNYSGSFVYWRVRAIDHNDHPLGVFSDAAEMFIDHSLSTLLKPLPNASFNIANTATLLYPVYSWIPVIGADRYEVEVLNQAPENPNGTAPSIYRIWSKEVNHALDCYDEVSRTTPGTYFWRVRALDSRNNPVGVFSDATPFIVDLGKGKYAATFGDSITHGGGAISYSPADWEYSFQSYLSFPTVNLGKSGDTAASMVARFEHDVLPFKPKFLVILGGTNSLRGGVPASQVIEELAAIRDKCLANGIRPIFLTLPPINPSAIERTFQEETVPNWQTEFNIVNKFIRQQRYFIDLEPYFTGIDGELPDHYAIDGLHLDIEGKKLMAHIINAHWEQVTR